MKVGQASVPAQAGRDAGPTAGAHQRPSALLDTRVIYCGDCLDQLKRLPDACIDLIYIDPPFNSNRNYEVFWGESSEPRPSGSGIRSRFAAGPRIRSRTKPIDFMRPRCVELARVPKKTGSFYYHCDWHASRYVKVTPGYVDPSNSDPSAAAPRLRVAHTFYSYRAVRDRSIVLCRKYTKFS